MVRKCKIPSYAGKSWKSQQESWHLLIVIAAARHPASSLTEGYVTCSVYSNKAEEWKKLKHIHVSSSPGMNQNNATDTWVKPSALLGEGCFLSSSSTPKQYDSHEGGGCLTFIKKEIEENI